MTTANNSEVVEVTAHGQVVGEITVHGNVGYTAEEEGMHLDMTQADAHIDLTSHSITVDPGQTLGFWIRLTQIGTSGHAYGPGVASDGGGHWNQHFGFRNDDGTAPATSGTHNLHFAFQKADEEYVASNEWAYNLDNNPWMHCVVVNESGTSDGVRFHIDDTQISVRNADTTSGGINLNDIGYGYAGSTDDGSGHKYMDEIGIWDRELTPTEISDWYAGTLPDNPIHLWLLDDDSDPSTAIDSAGSANGIINNCTYVEGDAA